MSVLAKTWDEQDGRVLWERKWFHDDLGYYAQLGPAPPVRYEDEDALWAGFELEAEQFHGERQT